MTVPSRPRTRKAVIPAAGLGTRFLPATKAMPKEMLPVVDRPAIEYVVAEARRAGLQDVLMITGRNKRALEDHFDRHPALEATLERKGDATRLAQIRESDLVGDIHYVRQGEALGLGHAVNCARRHVGDEPFAVLLGDDIIGDGEALLARMIDVQQRLGGSVVALMEVPEEAVSAYGVAAVEAVPGEGEDVVRVTGLVEKPAREDAPSTLAVIGRYVLASQVFDVLDRTPRPGRGDPADRRPPDPGRRRRRGRRRARRRLRRPPVRHGGQAGLPAGRRRVRHPARGAGRGPARLAQGVRGRALSPAGDRRRRAGRDRLWPLRTHPVG